MYCAQWLKFWQRLAGLTVFDIVFIVVNVLVFVSDTNVLINLILTNLFASKHKKSS
jgi:hypothetical protein